MAFLSGTIEKCTSCDDGSVEVYGFASTEAKDSQGEVILASAIEKALPAYLEYPTVREMHQPKVAGKAIEARIEGGKFWFGAKVVDPVAAKKVVDGVYKAFSIGGNARRRDPANPRIITDIDLYEVSLCDRPRNPDTAFAFFKAETGSDIRKSLDGVGFFASLIDSLTSLALGATYDAKDDADDASSLPADLVAWIAKGAELMAQMTVESLADQVSALKTAVAGLPGTGATAAPEADVIAKAGRRNSSADLSHLQAIHDHAHALGASCDPIAKARIEADGEAIAKVTADLDIAKADLGKVTAERDAALTRVKVLEAAPAPDRIAKADLGLIAVTKANDGQPATQVATPPLNLNGLSPIEASRRLAEQDAQV